MTLGLIARADNGGLAAQTWELARHVRPDRILLIDVEAAGRGPFRPERYDGLAERIDIVGYADRNALAQAVGRLVEAVETTFTAETFYAEEAALRLGAELGRRLIVHVNPELCPALYLRAARQGTLEVWLPTEWEYARVRAEVPTVSVAHVPIPLDRLANVEPLAGDAEPTLLHMGAPAMLDRAGTDLVIAAAQRMVEPCRLIVRSAPDVSQDQTLGVVRIQAVGPLDGPWWEGWEQYPAHALVAPRRYGGLSLPLMEAAGLGMPAVTLDRVPENLYPHTLRVAAYVDQSAKMRGGMFPVMSCSPALLAASMDHAVRVIRDHPDAFAKHREVTANFGRQCSWAKHAERWREVLHAEPSYGAMEADGVTA